MKEKTGVALNRMTIAEAAAAVIRQKGRPLSPSEIYGAIIEAGLYVFNTDNPVSVIRTQIRRRCLGLDFPSAVPDKLFQLTPEGRYGVLAQKRIEHDKVDAPPSLMEQLLALHREHEEQTRARILSALKALPPRSFELFAQRLLRAYGFVDVVVTRKSRDGGIDGFGHLPVGLSTVSVAFQCKRYNDKPIGREAIDGFRGAISGRHEQGYFFATSRFTSEAVAAQRRAGAVPIILFDGANIVDIMFRQSFGVTFRDARIAELALDTILDEE